MSFQNQQIAYAQTVATTPTYWPIILNRAPTPNDTNYKVGQFWIAQLPNGTKELFYLASQSNMVTSSNPTGALQSTWELISVNSALVSLSDNANTVVFPSLSTATPPDNIQFVAGSGISIVATPASNLITITNTGMASTETLTGNDGTPVSPSGGTIQTLGVTVANATYGQALYTNSGGGNIENFNIQLAAAIASTNVAKVGVAAFSSTQFAVDANGFVTLAGGSTPPILGITPDAHTGPGTSPVIPNGSGNIKIEGGATFATGTQANPIRTNSLAANTLDLQIQLAGSHAATSTADDFGVAQFDANMFTVTSGFVQVKNAGTTGVVTEVIGDDSNAVVPASGTGAITLDGVTVANATHAKPVYFAKNAASTEELDVQITTTSSSGSKNINNAGLASFDSAAFTVDSATGFIGLVGGSLPPTLTLTPNSGTSPVGPTGGGTINVVGTGSTTTLGSSNTVTVELTGLTQYDVLVGQGSTTIGLISPSTAGYVLTSNGGSAYPTFQPSSATGSVTNFTVDTTVGGGVNPVVPNNGNIIITSGPLFNTGTNANSLRTDTTAANTIAIELQRAGAGSGGTPIANNYGVSQFNSTNFSVSGGFVNSQNFTINTSGALSGGGSITLGGTLNLSATSTPFPWTDQSTGFTAVSNNGYFVTASLTATLNSSPEQGDVIRFVVTASATLTIQANTGHKIRLGSVIGASAGSAVNTKQGDAMNLVYRTADTTWYNFESPVGAWTIS